MLRSLFNLSRRPTPAAAPKAGRHPFRPEVEGLEERTLLTNNYLFVDFTPANGYASFASTFSDRSLRTGKGQMPKFLDINRDGRVNRKDFNRAVKAVADRAAQYLSGFNIKVIYGDFKKDTGLGERMLQQGIDSPDQVFVVYTGGTSNDGSWGLAAPGATLPPPGYVNETYANVWPSSIAKDFLADSKAQTAREFIDMVAWTVVHEFGHLVGLGHPVGHPPDDPFAYIMNYQSQNHLARAGFPDAWYVVDVFNPYAGQYVQGWMNPLQEMLRSLQGEPTWYAFGYNHTLRQGAGPGERSADGHEHSGCGCPVYRGAAADYVMSRDLGDPALADQEMVSDTGDTARATSLVVGRRGLQTNGEDPEPAVTGSGSVQVDTRAVDMVFSREKGGEVLATPEAGSKELMALTGTGLEDPFARPTL